MPVRKSPGEEKRLPRPFCIENSLYDKFSVACANKVIGKRIDGTIVTSSVSREIRLFIIKYLKDYEKNVKKK